MLSEESYKKINSEIEKFPVDQRQSAVMAALAIVQDEKGWLNSGLISHIAEYLGMPDIAVQEVASFYNMYNLKPKGKFKITICTNLPCALSGGHKAAEYLKNKLQVNFGETSIDNLFTLQEGECMGACADAPVLLVNNKQMHSFMSDYNIDVLIKDLKK